MLLLVNAPPGGAFTGKNAYVYIFMYPVAKTWTFSLTMPIHTIVWSYQVIYTGFMDETLRFAFFTRPIDIFSPEKHHFLTKMSKKWPVFGGNTYMQVHQKNIEKLCFNLFDKIRR